MDQSTVDLAPLNNFEDHARACVQRLRGALAELLNSVSADPTRPQQLSRQFGIDKSLSWRLSKTLLENDPLAVLPHLPGRSGLTILLRRFRAAGAEEHAVQSVQEAIQDFELMVNTHAGDRETLVAMASGRTPQAGAAIESYRKLSFRGNSATWGVLARVQMGAYFVGLSANPNMVDVATVCGLIGFRRLRDDVPWAIGTLTRWDLAGESTNPVCVYALDPEHGDSPGAPLMRQFCSKPTPVLQSVKTPNGMTRFVIPQGMVGLTAVSNLIAGWATPQAVPRYKESAESTEMGELGLYLNTPVELALHDLFVHRDIIAGTTCESALYSQLPGGPQYPQCRPDQGRLPQAESVIELGSPPHQVTPEVPNYSRLLDAVFKRTGWNPSEFIGFRIRIAYPPIPTFNILRFALRPPPQ